MTLAARELVPESPVIRRKLVLLQEDTPSRRRQVHRERVKKKSGLRKASLLLYVKVLSLVLPAFLFLALILANLIGYNEMSMIQEDIHQLKQEITTLQAESDYVRMSLAPYLEPEAMAKKAHDRLGMILPSDDHLLAIQASDGLEEDSQLAKENVQRGQ